jgi:hypothetical protein
VDTTLYEHVFDMGIDTLIGYPAAPSGATVRAGPSRADRAYLSSAPSRRAGGTS